ncbi:hypothetical protein EEI45_03700 [Erysipelothrix piscisicarius]|uniref:Uncharacterized protein n=1 Tax=Erysipelothrix piscisicarius TaxID=2485784 RepID=A0A3S8RM71_9FIRM|nr:hypothetical protein EEI45_03700 [Erysipelothrix piscisicarius]
MFLFVLNCNACRTLLIYLKGVDVYGKIDSFY